MGKTTHEKWGEPKVKTSIGLTMTVMDYIDEVREETNLSRSEYIEQMARERMARERMGILPALDISEQLLKAETLTKEQCLTVLSNFRPVWN